MENKLADNEIINCLNDTEGKEDIGIYCTDKNGNFATVVKLTDLVDLLNRQKAEIERLNTELVGMRGAANSYKMHYDKSQAKIKEIWEERNRIYESLKENKAELEEYRKAYAREKSEAIKEFAEKVYNIFSRYGHLHVNAERARLDDIEALDGTRIEMQSVWDVFTLKKHEMAEYEEMNRLQENIETIAKDRILIELEKDFRLLVKEMEGAEK